jgi:hypothetical protein
LNSAFKALRSFDAKHNSTNQTAVESSKPDKTASEKNGDDIPTDPNKPTPTSTKSESEWADATKGAVQQDNFQVKIAQVSVGKVPIRDFNSNTISKNDLLMVKMELLNKNPTKKVEYHSWMNERDFTVSRNYAALKDNFANNYDMVSFGLGTYPDGAVRGSASIYPDKPVTDILVFEIPLESIEYLRLELPAKNFGGTGMLRFQIPKSMIQR